jgi:hypothetical protein
MRALAFEKHTFGINDEMRLFTHFLSAESTKFVSKKTSSLVIAEDVTTMVCKKNSSVGTTHALTYKCKCMRKFSHAMYLRNVTTSKWLHEQPPPFQSICLQTMSSVQDIVHLFQISSSLIEQILKLRLIGKNIIVCPHSISRLNMNTCIIFMLFVFDSFRSWSKPRYFHA